MSDLRKVVGESKLVKSAMRRLSTARFPGSASYWDRRYRDGGDSGPGSHGRLARYKAEFLNDFVRTHEVESVIEFGCGDGRQLELASYPSYIGIDSSRTAIGLCLQRFGDDDGKWFLCCDTNAMSAGTSPLHAELALSLDVVYHLVEDLAYHNYMARLFDSADRFVAVYSSNWDVRDAPHVRHRHFTRWVYENAPAWRLVQAEDPPYPYDPSSPDETGWASFFVFSRDRELRVPRPR